MNKKEYLLKLFLIILLTSCVSCIHTKKIENTLVENNFENKDSKKIIQKLSKIEKRKKENNKEENKIRKKIKKKLDKDRQYKIIEIKKKKKYNIENKKINVNLVLEKATLQEFIYIISKLVGINYVIDSNIRGSITISIKGIYSKEEFIKLIENVLNIYNISLVEENNVFKVIATKKIPKVTNNVNIDIVKIRYLDVRKILEKMSYIVAQNILLVPELYTNSIIIINASKEEKNLILRLLSVLDVDLLREVEFYLYKPKVLGAKKIEEYLKKIFKSKIFSFSPDNYLEIISIDELNILLVIAKTQEAILNVKRWIREIDKGEVVGKAVFVYQVENGSAKELADLLQNVFREETSKRKVFIRAVAKKGVKNEIKTNIPTGIKIIPDEINNSLIIVGSKTDYEKVINLLKKIDITPRQVVVEVLIAEISLNKNLEYGVEWWIKTNFKKNHRRYLGDIKWQNVYMGKVPKGFSFILNRNTDPRFLIAALDEISDVKILSSPVIIATNNKEAYIQVGQEVPTVSRKVVNTAADNPNITQDIEYRDIGIILKVKPYINSSGLIKMNIVQEVSEITGTILDSPVFSKRKIQTSIIVQSGNSIVIGGLIRHKFDTANQGVPIIKDIPLIGNAFKWQRKSVEKTELLIIITPRVVRNIEEAQKVMLLYKKKIDDLKRRILLEFH